MLGGQRTAIRGARRALYHAVMLRLSPPKLSPWLQGPAAALGYALAWAGLFEISQLYWYLPAGLRFGALLLAPRRLWPWLIGAEWCVGLLLRLHGAHPLHDPLLLAWMVLPQPLVVAAIIALMRRRGMPVLIERPERAVRLLVGALLAALASTAVNAPILHTLAGLPLMHVSSMLANFALGDYVGILLITPLLIMLLRAPLDNAQARALLTDMLLILLPTITGLLLMMGESAPLARYARVLTLVPVLYFAFRHGWRGASLAMLASSAAVTAHAGLQLRPEAPAEAQLFLAVAGTGALLLGAATDALRQSGLRLALQNARLANVNQRLDQLAQQLATAARSNLREEEGERKRIAAELHDELGQNLTAIQIRVKIAQNRLETAGLGDISASINDIVATMRRSVRGLLESLRPAALNEFGLARALDEGPLRDLIQSANMSYGVELRGDLRLLDEDMRNTLYRIVQEAATNCVRHARAHSFSLRLRVGRRGDQLLALLDIRDDGVGLGNAHGVPSTPGLGRGLHGMRDRVLALGGTFRVLESTHGLRLRILLRQPQHTH